MEPGEWFMIPLGEQYPERVTVYKGQVHTRSISRFITRQQALALWRWHGNKGLYYSYKRPDGQWKDVRVCGDIDVWFDGVESNVQAKIHLPK